MADDAGQIGHDRLLSDHDSTWETGTAGGVLQVGDFFGIRGLKRQISLRKCIEEAGFPDMFQIKT